MSSSVVPLRTFFQYLGKPTSGFPSIVPGKTKVPCSSMHRSSVISRTGSPTGLTEARSLLSSNRRQLFSTSTPVHFRPTISFRRQPVRARNLMTAREVPKASFFGAFRRIAPSTRYSCSVRRRSLTRSACLFLDDPLLYRVGENAPEQTYRTSGCAGSTTNNRATSRLGLHIGLRPSGRDVPDDAVDVG